MIYINLFRWATAILLLPLLACTLAKPTRQPAPTLEQLTFEIQTSTPTVTPIHILADAPTYTPDPNTTPTPIITTTLTVTATTLADEETATPEKTATPQNAAPAPTATPSPPPIVPTAEPLRGGAWDFEEGFAPWRNPHGDECPGSGLANGWIAFTTRDQYGSSCMNQTIWEGNVYTGESAQEITFAYVGSQAGVFRPAPAIPGHRYTIEAFMRREFSPAKVDMALGVDVNGGTNWQAETVQWFPWNEDLDDAWAKTETTVTAAGETMTIFIKGAHLYPEPGGTLRIDSISIVDIGPE